MVQLIAGTSDQVDQDIIKKVGANYTGHVGYSGKDYNNLPIQDGVDASDNYYDTGFPVSKTGPPYILCRMEVYPDLAANGSTINIYSQMHIHYSAEIEFIPLEKRYTYLPTYTQNLLVTSSADAFATGCKTTTNGNAEGRVVSRITGPSKNDAYWL